jgi:pimeloyl-ACP methyl ester carboxylesterase
MTRTDPDATLGFYLEAGRRPAFAIHHPAVGPAAGTAVLICAPWGWDEVASYRVRKRWAERLAAAGFPTLRFDLPAVGDSDGMPSDPALVEAWVAAIAAAAAWLRGASETRSVAAFGLGLGGLLARQAIASGAPVDQLILWGTPDTGRAFAREARAFSRLQMWPGDDDLPAGSLEAGGFLLAADTLAEVNSLPGEGGAAPRRALVLDRDGVKTDGLRDSLRQEGVDVTAAVGAGWGALVEHPERSRLPEPVAVTIEDWLREDDPPAPGPGPAVAIGGVEVLQLDGAVESPFRFEGSFGKGFGILAAPGPQVDAAADGLVAVFLNAGAVRHSGPDRLWVEASRRAAAAGIPSLRVDLEAIGEADGDEKTLSRVEEFYIPRYADELVGLLDQLEATGVGRRFALVGLCAGGFWSFRAALGDRRVSDVVLANAGALYWHDELVTQREARKLTRVADARWLRRLVTGDIRPELIVGALRSLVRRLVGMPGRAWRRLRGGETAQGFDADLDLLREAGTRLTLAFSSGEALDEELDSAGVLGRLERWPNLDYERLPGSDHTLRPLGAQRALLELVARRLEIAASGPAQSESRQR